MVPDVVEHVDVALVNVHKGVGRKVLGLVFPSTPLVKCSIQLMDIRYDTWKEIKSLTAVATNATIGTGTSRSVTKCSSSCLGN